jgi:microcystin-dependent protein
MYQLRPFCAAVAGIAAALLLFAPPRPAGANADPFIGEVSCGGYNFCPKGWMECNGQLLPIAQNTALFSLLGTMYGGDGKSNFALPNLQGRTLLHQGSGPGLTPRSVAETGGEASHALTTAEIPVHSHQVLAFPGAGNSQSPANAVWAVSSTGIPAYAADLTPRTGMAADALASAGSGTPINLLKPYQTLKCCIAVQGIFPPRN